MIANDCVNPVNWLVKDKAIFSDRILALFLNHSQGVPSVHLTLNYTDRLKMSHSWGDFGDPMTAGSAGCGVFPSPCAVIETPHRSHTSGRSKLGTALY